MRIVLLALVALCYCTQVASLIWDDDYNEKGNVYLFLKFLTEHQSDILGIVSEYDLLNNNAFVSLTEELESAGDAEQFLTCAECRSIIALVKGLVNSGRPWEEVKNASMGICYDLLPGEGMDPDIVCEGAIDNYGPHVMYIFNETALNPLGICTKYYLCGDGEEGKYTKPMLKADRKLKPKYDKKDAFTVLHITDIHIDPKYDEGAPNICNLPLCCRDYWPGNGSAHYWGDYRCNLPAHTAEAFLEQLGELRPDVIAYTGDNPPHAVWEETQEGQLEVSEYVAAIIGEYFPGVPAYPTIGNHEMYPTNLYYIARPEIQEFNTEYLRFWQPLADFDQEQIDTITYAGYYSIPINPRLRVISYNSNYGATDNFYGILNELSDDWAEHQRWLEDEFEAARESDEKILLLGHHPTGGTGVFNFYSSYIRNLTMEYGDLFVLHLQGHGHSDTFKVAIDPETGEARDVQLSSPAAGTRTNINPSARLFYIDRATLEPLDFENYYINLDTAMDTNEINVELFYTASEAYGMDDLTPASFADMVARMETDDDLFYSYKYHQRTGTSNPSPCTGSCRQREICSLTNVHHWDNVACRDAIDNQ